MTIGALVLAAGTSRRFGSDKRRFLVDGEPLLRRTVTRVIAAGLPCRVCLRPGDGDVPLWLDLPGVEFLECPGAQRGMGATLAEGVAHCGDWEALLVVLGDMAWTATATLGALAATATRQRIVQPTYRGRPGQPVAFGERFFPELQALCGDRGGRDVIARHPDELTTLPVDDPGIHRDLDLPPP